jgi:hypothetical protein
MTLTEKKNLKIALFNRFVADKFLDTGNIGNIINYIDEFKIYWERKLSKKLGHYSSHIYINYRDNVMPSGVILFAEISGESWNTNLNIKRAFGEFETRPYTMTADKCYTDMFNIPEGEII